MPNTVNEKSCKKLIRITEAKELTKVTAGVPCTGTEYTKQFPDQARPSNRHIPTFATFCKWAAKHPLLTLNVEIKSHAEQTDLYDPPDIIVSDVVDLLERHDLHHRCIISSFDWRVLVACAERAPTVTRGHLTLEQNHGTAMVPNIFDGSPWMSGVTREDHKDSLAQTISALGGKVWCPYFKDLTESELAKAKELGLLVNVWTVNSVSDIIRMAEMGVDGIISDYPARVQNILSQ
jgi:glycerophosphoryl diester phosphodiesterase